MKRKYLPVKGHPNLAKDPESGAVVNLATNSNREKKQAMRRRSKETEERLDRLESTMNEILSMLKEQNK